MVYANVKRLCDENNISIYALEKDCKFTTGTIAKWAKSIPRADRLKLVADRFGCTVEQLLEDGT